MGVRARAAWIVGVAGWLVLAGGVAAAAEPVPLRVTRAEGAGECPDAATLAARVATSRSDAYSPAPSASVGVHVAFERDGSGLRARISTVGGRQRTLAEPVPGCDGLAEAVVLALLLSADGQDADPPSRSLSPLPEAPRDPSASRGAGIEVRASAGGVASIGAIRALSGGAMIGAHVGPREGIWSVGAVGLWLPPTSVALTPSNPTAPSGSVDIAYLGGALEGCARFLRRVPLRAEACARLDGGVIDASARGFTTSSSSGRFQAAGGGTLRASYELVDPAAVFLELGVRVPFHRETFAVEHAGTVYDPPSVGLLGAAGVAWSFR